MHNAISGHANSIGNGNMAMVNEFMNNFKPGYRTLADNKNEAYRQTASNDDINANSLALN